MKRLITVLLAIMMLLTLASCQTGTESGTGSSEGSNDSGSRTPESTALDTSLEMRITVLSGTTGMGIAPLMKSAQEGKEALNYNFSIATAADQIAPGIIQGSIDIAAVPTNLAATLYNKTNGNIKVLCGNTKGVLYLVSADSSIKTVADLKGKTIHVPGQGTNPEYLLRYVLEGNDLEVGKDITIDYTYTSPDELTTALAATDKVSIALIPEPKVSAAIANNSSLSAVIDLTEEWNKVSGGTELFQGCIIVRKEFYDEHPLEVAEFLKQYKASVESVVEDPATASTVIAGLGIVPNAGLAQKAIPNCNLCYVVGEELSSALTKLYEALFALDPASVGGAVPDSGLYCE